MELSGRVHARARVCMCEFDRKDEDGTGVHLPVFGLCGMLGVDSTEQAGTNWTQIELCPSSVRTFLLQLSCPCRQVQLRPMSPYPIQSRPLPDALSGNAYRC
eukprot:1160536-Pelagomonas_calceolata.AAC.4